MNNQVNLNNPRAQAIRALRESIPADSWSANAKYIAQLRSQIKRHPLFSNPIISVLNNEVLDLPAIKNIHLEYRHAIVQIFTDALLMAQFNTRQLEPRLHPGSKLAARFLLTLNILDEFGFSPGCDSSGYYQGNPSRAHYPLFEQLLDDLGVGMQERQSYQPSKFSDLVRFYLEASYGSYTSVIALLAVAEEQVIMFSPPLRNAVQALGFNVQSGYYHVHGVSSDKTADAFDDDHQDDLWYAVTQACVPQEYEQLSKICLEYCDLWQAFWDTQNASVQRQGASLACA